MDRVIQLIRKGPQRTSSYQVNDRLAISASPKVAVFGKTELAGLGAGISYALFEGLELIAEATAVGADATDATSAAGLRHGVPDWGLSVDAHATNAIGRTGIGTMIAQHSTRFSIGATKRFSIGRSLWKGRPQGRSAAEHVQRQRGPKHKARFILCDQCAHTT